MGEVESSTGMGHKKAKRVYKELKYLGMNVLACVFWVIAVRAMLQPNQIALGGTTGITLIINHLTGAQIGIMSFLLNIPLLGYAWFVLGRGFVFRTLITVVLFSFMMDYVIPSDLFVYNNDPLLAAITAGVLNGLGTGLVFSCGSSGGGTDLIIKVIKRKRPHLSVGQIILAVNGVIMGAAALLYGGFETLLYGLVVSFTSGQVVDVILNGASSANSIVIITKQPKAISQAIIEQLHRSATIVAGEGAFSSAEVSVMFCVVRKPELQRLKELVSATDKEAFLIIQEAKQVVGKSFVASNP